MDNNESDVKSEAYSYHDDDVVLIGYPRNEEERTWIPYYDWIISISCRFDISFVIISVLQSIDNGFSLLIWLSAQDLFKSYMDQEPSDMAFYNSLGSLPWSFKIFYGLITDNVPIFGLKRKPYIIFFTLLKSVMLFLVYQYQGDSAMTICIYLLIVNIAQAFKSVVMDALVIIQARKDPVGGSQDLISLNMLVQSIAGAAGGIIAAIITERYHPKYGFLLSAIISVITAIGSIFLSKESERDLARGEVPIYSDFSSELMDG